MSPPAWPKNLRAKHTRKNHAAFIEKIELAASANQTRPLTREAVISLREVTKDTVRAVVSLDVSLEQEALVAPNAVSIAQAHFYPEAWFRAIYADETPVGFAMLEDWSQVADALPRFYNCEQYVALWRFMIDARYQQLGYGSTALKLLIAQAKTRPNVTVMTLSFVPADKNPEGFYLRHGFARTGEEDDGELIMALRLV
jgi:diamine N-acetyltransferase